ncbi:uncharacterized protein LOC141655787 [Silene latifolia]|uniref:uncharacterized protein LOC141655787 n=1 Tax=Silene latifolia TaxID=37657 RepID=UPI003D773250
MTNGAIQTTEQSNPQNLIHVENPGAKITLTAFNGNNYDEWSHDFQLAILAKGKSGYIDGTIKKPKTTDTTFETWRSTNALVTAWIYNSIEYTLRKQISRRPEAKLLWDDIKNRFCQTNDARIYKLQADLMACRQSPTESLMNYYGRLIQIWDEILESDPLPECSCNPCVCNLVSLLDSRREKKKVRDFLMGLDDRYENTRSQILAIRPLPSLDLVYNRLLQDEGMRHISNARNDTRPDSMVFAARVQTGSRQNGGKEHTSARTNNGPSRDPTKTYCIACKKPGHYFQSCFRVTGAFPDWWGERPRDRIFVNPNDTDLSNAVFVPDVQGRANWERLKNKGTAPGAKSGNHSNFAGTNANSSTGFASTQGSSSLTNGTQTLGFAGTTVVHGQPSVSSFDNIDLNKLSPQQLETIASMWQARQAQNDLVNGPFLEDGDWCG